MKKVLATHQYQVKQPDLRGNQYSSRETSSVSPSKRKAEQEILKMSGKYTNQSRFCELLSSSESSNASSRANSFSNPMCNMSS